MMWNETIASGGACEGQQIATPWRIFNILVVPKACSLLCDVLVGDKKGIFQKNIATLALSPIWNLCWQPLSLFRLFGAMQRTGK